MKDKDIEKAIDILNDPEVDMVYTVESAYNEIANRKGKMINGTFVKSEDLKNARV